MILKGNQRGGGRSLATHLMNSFDNERVEIADVRGAVAQDLHGAFAEWYAIAKATSCKKYLYSLSINPDHRQPWKRDDYLELVARLERNMGMADQPRAVVFHVKEGREHCHVVWSRIDTEKMRAVQLSFDRKVLRRTAQEFAKDRGLTLPKGMQKDAAEKRAADRAEKNYGEKQQEERTGITKDERRQTITDLWKSSDNGRAFVEALEQHGYYLARGEKVPYVVVDLYGEVHSLPRQIEGVKTKQLAERLADFPVAKLPTIEAAQECAAKQRAVKEMDRAQVERAPAAGPTPAERLARLQGAHAKRRGVVDAELKTAILRQIEEQDSLRMMQDAENTGIVNARLQKQPKGLTAFLVRITGIQMLVDWQHRKEDQQRTQDHQEQRNALGRRHDRERQDIKAQYRALARVEKRELRSLQTALHREEFQAIARDSRQTDKGTEKPPLRLTPEQQERLAAFRGAARDTAQPKAPATPRAKKKPRARGGLAGLFNRVADRLSGHQQTDKGSSGPAKAETPPREQDSSLTDRFNSAADIKPPAPMPVHEQSPEPAATNPDSLTEAFNRRARQKADQERDAERDPGRSRGGPNDPGRGRGR